MPVRPARYAKNERKIAGTPPRLNIEPWPILEVGRALREHLLRAGGKERASATLRRLSGDK